LNFLLEFLSNLWALEQSSYRVIDPPEISKEEHTFKRGKTEALMLVNSEHIVDRWVA
jgi:hypothetical protein